MWRMSNRRIYANEIDEKMVCAVAVAELIAIEIHHGDSDSVPFVSIIATTTNIIIVCCLLGLLEPIPLLVCVNGEL